MGWDLNKVGVQAARLATDDGVAGKPEDMQERVLQVGLRSEEETL